MTPAGRAFLGAGVGAILTLALHPASKPFFTVLARAPDPNVFERSLDVRKASLPPPEDAVQAAQWLHSAADRLAAQQPLRPTELASVLRVADAAAKHEPDNAFWNQMRAVFLHRAGRRSEALHAWQRASVATAYNDHQSDRLRLARGRIADEVGSHQAWQLAVVYYARSFSASLLVERFARTIVSGLGFERRSDLARRTATLRNGRLLRDGSRSIAIGVRGANIVDIASYPRNLSMMGSPKKLLLAQIGFYNALMSFDMEKDAGQVFEVFRSNDGWRALTEREPTEQNAGELALQAVVAAVAPAAMVLACLAGGLFWLLGCFIHRWHQPSFPTPGLVGAALLSGSFAFAVTSNLVAAAAILLCVMFLRVGSHTTLRRGFHDAGPLFSFLALLLAACFGVAMSGYAVGRSLPSAGVFPAVGVAADFYGPRSVFAGLCAIVVGLLLLAAPAWGLAQRRTTPFMLGLAFRRFGAVLAVGSLVATILATPAFVHADQLLEEAWTQLVGNEPVYYLLR